MFTEKIFTKCLALFCLGWLFSCQNNSASAVVVSDSIVKKLPVSNNLKPQPIIYDSTKNYIYLTFDDGPQNGTVACFELCKKLSVKASFFMVGQHANSTKTKDIVQQIRAAYPQILLCNHSTTHANDHYRYFYHHPEMAAQDFYLAQKTLNVPYKIIRLPGNSAWIRKNEIKASHLVDAVCVKLDSAGYNVIGWDVEWSFNHKTANPLQSPKKMINIVDSALIKHRLHTRNHLVLLAHDRMFRNQNYIDSLQKFITQLQQDPKNVFETINHYPGLK